MTDGNWHTYANTYDVWLSSKVVVVTWHGTSKVVPGDDRDLIEWAFAKGREFERGQVNG